METLNIQEILQDIDKIEKQLKHIKRQLLEEEKTEYKAFVYCHILPNNKYYIGVAKEPKQRWSNGEGYRANKEFYSDIKKYKWENIKHLILLETETIENAKSLELVFISLYEATKYGYNKRDYISLNKKTLNDILTSKLNDKNEKVNLHNKNVKILENIYKKVLQREGARV